MSNATVPWESGEGETFLSGVADWVLCGIGVEGRFFISQLLLFCLLTLSFVRLLRLSPDVRIRQGLNILLYLMSS